MSYDERFYGLYSGICMDNNDPDKENKIMVKVPQVSGESHNPWARPCTPVTDNSNHPDHKTHLAAEVAALLNAHSDHVVSGTTGTGSTDSHTHTFSSTVSHTNNHTGNSLYLQHPHVVTVDTTKKWNDSLDVSTTVEHTPHRLVPNINQKVWVMFEGGDPNFPVWMGVEI